MIRSRGQTSGTLVKSAMSARQERGFRIAGNRLAKPLCRFSVVVLQQPAELAFAFDVGQRNRGCRRGELAGGFAFASRWLGRWHQDFVFLALMRTATVIKRNEGLSQEIQVLLPEDQEMIQHSPTQRLVEAFDERLQIRCSIGCLQYLSVGRLDRPVEGGGELGIAVVLQVELRRLVVRQLADEGTGKPSSCKNSAPETVNEPWFCGVKREFGVGL